MDRISAGTNEEVLVFDYRLRALSTTTTVTVRETSAGDSSVRVGQVAVRRAFHVCALNRSGWDDTLV